MNFNRINKIKNIKKTELTLLKNTDMYKVVKKNKTYKKRKLVIYDDNDKRIVDVTPWGGWFCWSNRFDKNFSLVRMEVLKNLYWLLGQDCDEEEWERSIERWDTGKGVMGSVTNESQFFNENEKLAARMSFNQHIEKTN